MKISFNDKRLQTTFEYPPESSLVQEEEAEAQEEDGEEEEEEEEEESSSDGVVEKPFSLFLPRATFVNSVGPESPHLPDGSSGECPRVGMGGPVGSWATRPHTCLLAHRPVRLHSKTLCGLQ